MENKKLFYLYNLYCANFGYNKNSIKTLKHFIKIISK